MLPVTPLSESKVNQLYLSILTIHEVFGLDVSVGDVELVTVVDGHADVEHYLAGLLLIEIVLVV